MPKPNRTRRSAFLFAALLVAITLVAYWPAMHGQFIWDDDAWTTGISHLLRDASGLRAIWSEPTALQQYYPLTGTTFWIDYQLWGFQTFPYHLVNVLLHAIAVLLFWKLLLELEIPGAWLAAALFALHPIMVESVAWITERKNVLSMVFFLGALLAYGRFNSCWKTTDPPRPRWGSYALALVFLLAALLSKTTTFCLPAVILLICWWKHGRIRWRADVLPALPFFAIAIGFSAITFWLEQTHVGARGQEWELSFPQRCLIAGRAFWFYLAKLAWPENLCFIYTRWKPDATSVWQWLFPVAALGAVAALWFGRKKIGRGPVTAMFFFVGTLFPVLGFMNAYGMRYSYVWDHWVYLPSLGILALVAAALVRAAGRASKPGAVPGVAVVLLPVLAILTWRQCAMYSDMETLWRTTIAKSPAAFLAYNNLGHIFLERNQYQQAIEHFEMALEIDPTFIEPENNLGNALLRAGRTNDAIIHFEKAVANPGTDRGNAAASHYNLGNAWLQIGNLKEAITQFTKALEFQPGFARARNNLGVAFLRLGQTNEALVSFQQAVDADPNLVDARNNLGDSLVQRGEVEKAITQYQAAVRLRPDNGEFHSNLAIVLALRGRSAEAVAEFRRTSELMPQSALAHHRFAMALEGQKDFAGAIEQYRKVLELEPNHTVAANNLAWLLATSADPALRDGAKAVELALRCRQISGSDNYVILDTLAAAYAEAGRFPEAIATAGRAAQLARTQSNPALAAEVEARLKGYQNQTPFHQKP